MDELVVSTEVYADPADVYEFLLEFPRYGRYSEYLREVRTLAGDGGPGTRYALTFAWWKLTYTAHSEVTDVEPPVRIDWAITKDIDAGGCWRITPLGDGSEDADGDGGSGDGDEHDAGSGESDTERDGTDEDGTDGDGTDDGPTCRVALEVEFDPSSASSDALDLPRLVSFNWVLKKAIPLIRSEAERVVERAVADLEGRTREIDLDVYVDSTRI
ncbi:SRPBCC family protein [Halorubrum sp. DTA98]|uniref:SRPBCC family protein n=1 Tax=Halorubrum sp. DTA98 TaxID=3402163 RepID=UPI003AAA2AAA